MDRSRNRSPSPQKWRTLARDGMLSSEALTRALELSFGSPNGVAWRRFVDRLLLILGAAALVLGVASFIAFNWQDFESFSKIAVVELGILATALVGWYLGLNRLAGKVALTAAALLTVCLMALYGQIYQTGADHYGLFVVAFVLVTPWVLSIRFGPLWLVYWALSNLCLTLAWLQLIGLEEHWVLFLLLVAALNGVSWWGWEFACRRGATWLDSALPHRLGPRLMAFATFGALLVPSWYWILFGGHPLKQEPLGFGALVAVVVAVFFVLWFFCVVERRGFMLNLALTSLISLTTSAAWRFGGDSLDLGDSSLLLIAFFLLFQMALAVLWLRHLAQQTELL